MTDTIEEHETHEDINTDGDSDAHATAATDSHEDIDASDGSDAAEDTATDVIPPADDVHEAAADAVDPTPERAAPVADAAVPTPDHAAPVAAATETPAIVAPATAPASHGGSGGSGGLPTVLIPSDGNHRRFGRHVHHDPRSRNFPAAVAPRWVTTMHQRTVPAFDQGDVGSCTGNAAAGMLCTKPFALSLTEADALSFYEAATHIDSIRGVYPPNDTGSSGLAVMKVLKNRGLIRGYTHAFGLDHVLRALVKSPGITGITWLTGCDNPDANGVVQYRGAVRGGHEPQLLGLDVEKSLVWFMNSWGPNWGLNGRFAMSFSDYELALADHGDATFPIL